MLEQCIAHWLDCMYTLIFILALVHMNFKPYNADNALTEAVFQPALWSVLKHCYECLGIVSSAQACPLV